MIAPIEDDSAAERSCDSQPPHAQQEQKCASLFVRQLYAEVTNEAAPKAKTILAWDHSGEVLIVKDSEALVDHFLATTSVDPNLGAFLRVLHDLGFVRRGLFCTHTHFQRGRPELLHLVRSRRRCKSPSAVAPALSRQISSASLVVVPLVEGSALTEKPPLDDGTGVIAVTVDEMRITAMSLYLVMPNSVRDLNAAVEEMGYRVVPATDGSSGSQYNTTPPFAVDPSSHFESPDAVDRIFDWPRGAMFT
ncbi:hypothetical protein T492DRAFT_875845 [Pavlovales sp. CCMP2436]|nr:hypothetical protein T492DRAFT_875845 [Pavlovales sp. CCMP2436]